MRPLNLHTIVAATDLGPASDAVVRAAGELAAVAGARLHLVHALGSDVPQTRPGDPGDPDAAGFETATAALAEQAARCLPVGVEAATARVEIAGPVEATLRVAADAGADLLVLGPHRAREGEREGFGATADRLVRTAPVPCLVVRGPLALPLRSVLAAADLSAGGRAALEVALSWTTALRAPAASADSATRLHVVHVAAPGADVDERARALHAGVADALGVLGAQARVEVREEVVAAESVPDAVLALAQRHDAGLVVLGTRRETGAEALGSVSSPIAQRAPGAVVLVPPGYGTE